MRGLGFPEDKVIQINSSQAHFPGVLPAFPLLRDDRLLRTTLRREPLLSLTEPLVELLLPVASLSRIMLSYPLLTILFLLEKYREVFPIAGGKSPLSTLVVSLA